mgnify:CR=1 FL=1|tara:strand:+ start:1147 stop:1833 length:687 start_codon:yes stop_codon:yes gene_type:complete
MRTKTTAVNPLDAHAHLPISKNAQLYCLAGCFPGEWAAIERQVHQAFQIGFGHHPWFAAEKPQYDLLLSFLNNHSDAFVGEIGLDRSRKHKATINLQKKLFVDQLTIAREYQRPVAIHLVRSSALGYELIHKHYGPKVYLHGYICSVEESQMYPQAFFGFHLRMFQSPKTPKLISSLSIKNILIESDGESDPNQLRKTVVNIAKIKGLSEDYVISETFQNALRWLNIE